MARWEKGEKTIQFLIGRDRLEGVEVEDLASSANVLIARAALRVEATAAAALKAGDVDGAYVAAYDAYRMAAESLLVRQGLRATGGDGSHMAIGMPCQPSLGGIFRYSPSQHSNGSGVLVTQRSTSIPQPPHYKSGRFMGN